MQKKEMDKTGSTIIKICIFSIVLSLTALFLSAAFNYWINDDKSTNVNADTIPIIVIDAGHGGVDGGAIAKDGTKEKDLNLSLALTLSDMLESFGYDVILTRSDDALLSMDGSSSSKKLQDLKKRVDIVNNTDNPILVSLHMNKFAQEKYSGVQVFYSPNNDNSSILADKIQNNIKSYLQADNNREIKKAGSNIYLLNNINTTGVLVECGFLSNPNECELLKNEEYRKELASVICMSIIEFFDTL